MRENCTYGSMRDILRAEGESRSDALAEVRAYPITRGVPLYSTYAEINGRHEAVAQLQEFKLLRKGKAVVRA